MTATDNAQRTLVTFAVDDIWIGVDIDRVQEINRLNQVTVVPRAPAGVLGMVNLRGNLITVLDLQYLLKRSGIELGRGSRNVVLDSSDDIVGLAVDGVRDVVMVSGEGVVVPLPPHLSYLDATYFTGVVNEGGELLVLLNIDAVTTAKEALSATVA